MTLYTNKSRPEMARLKQTIVISSKVPLTIYETIKQGHNTISKYLLELIKADLHKKQPDFAIGYCNNNNCKHGHTPDRIQLIFDEKEQVWCCYNCQEVTPDIDEKTICWKEIKDVG